MNAARLVLVALLPVSIGGLAWLARQRDAEATKGDARLLARLTALEAAEPGRVEPSLLFSRRDEPARAVALPVPSTESSRPPVDGGTEEGVGYTPEELEIAYANDFDAEAVDPGWAIASERSLGKDIDSHLPKGSVVLGLQCRSRFCRMDVVHESIEVSNQMLMDLFFMERNGPLSRTDQGFRSNEPVATADGKQRFTIYIGRPGVSMTVTPSG